MNEQRKKKPNSGLRNRSNNSENPTKSSQYRTKMNGSQKNGLQRQSSVDVIRKKVEEEGRAARNLITWSVPLEDDGINKNQKSPVSTPKKTQRARSTSASSQKITGQRDRTMSPALKKHMSDGMQTSTPSTPPHQTAQSLKKDLRARYWAFLFDNLRRAVDEIYLTCETDESVVECKEAIMMLEQSTNDFKSLIQRLELLRAYEKADKSQRPTSLAWEVRKTSPGKSLSQSQGKEHFIPSPTVSRTLNFGIHLPEKPQVSGSSWADRVKNSPPVTTGNVPEHNKSSQECVTDDPFETNSDISVGNTEDQEGWETVQKGKYGKLRRSHSGNLHKSPSQSQTNLSSKGKSPQPNAINNKNEPVRPSKSATSIQKRKPNGSLQERNSKTPENNISAKPILNQSKSPNPVVNKNGSPILSYSKAHLSNRAQQSVSAQNSADPNINCSQRPRADSKDSEKENINLVIDTAKTEQKPDQQFVSNFDDSVINKTEDSQENHDQNSTLVENSEGDEHYNVTAADVDAEDESLDEQIDNALESALIEEETLEDKLEKENEEALQQASVDELIILRELAQAESLEIEVETEPETEAESDLGNTGGSVVTVESEAKTPEITDWDSLVKQFESGTNAKKSWGDIAEEDEVSTRIPGRCVHMHEKLLSPSRKRSPKESKKRHEAKQAKAQELREKHMLERTERIRNLTNKVEEVRRYKDELWCQKKELTVRKLEQAEEKRQFMLQSKIRKAHEEETKVNEIAFINTLEAQNKLHDIMVKHQEVETRLQDLQEERQRKLDEDAAKKLAVEGRRKALQAERIAKLQEMHDKRAEREKIAGQRQQEKEKERQEAKYTKEKEREERMTILKETQQQHIENLQRKIKQKQSETEQRHRERLDQIREKAFEMSIMHHSSEDHNEAPLSVPYEKKKFCSVCNVMISSEVYLLSHLRGKKHQLSLRESSSGQELSKGDIESFNLKHILDAPPDKPDPQTCMDKERQKSLKKRCKKLRQRMTQRGAEYENALSGKQQTVESDHRAKLQKIIKDMNKYLSTPDKGPWPQNKVSALDRALGEIGRILEKKVTADQAALRLCGGLTTLNRILLVITDSSRPDSGPVVPIKSLVLTCNVFRLACRGYYDNCHYMLFSNKLGSLVDLLVHQLNILIPDDFCSVTYNTNLNSSSGGVTPTFKLPSDPLSSALIQLLATVTSCLAKCNPTVNSSEASAERMSVMGGGDAFTSRANDIVSYVISVGVVDKVSTYLDNVRGPLNNDTEAADFVQHCLGLLIGMTRLLSKRAGSIFGENKKSDDPTHLIATFQVTNLCGIVSLMYGLLLHSGAPTRGGSNSPPELPSITTAILTTGFKMLNQLATLDLGLLQSTLGSEGVSLEFRHIASYLLWSCNNPANEELLHEVILCVGYFTVLSADNQHVIQSGQPPTVLQQLCQLPFQYFSDPRLTPVLFPTLIACCYQCESNRGILQQELSCSLLANFIEEKCLEAQQQKQASPGNNKNKTSKDKDSDPRMTFTVRIPQEEWEQVQTYFST